MGVGEARAETAVDEISDEGRTGETEKFVAAAMKFVGATEETGAADVVGHTRFDGRDERGNIDRIMRAVGIDEDADGRGDLSDGETEGGAFAASLVADNACASGESHGSGAVGGAAFDDHDMSGVVAALFHHGGDGGLFIASRNDSSDVRIGTAFGQGERLRLQATMPNHATGAEENKRLLLFAEMEDVGKRTRRGVGRRRRRRGSGRYHGCQTKKEPRLKSAISGAPGVTCDLSVLLKENVRRAGC